MGKCNSLARATSEQSTCDMPLSTCHMPHASSQLRPPHVLVLCWCPGPHLLVSGPSSPTHRALLQRSSCDSLMAYRHACRDMVPVGCARRCRTRLRCTPIQICDRWTGAAAHRPTMLFSRWSRREEDCLKHTHAHNRASLAQHELLLSGAMDEVRPAFCSPKLYSRASCFQVVVTVARPLLCASMVMRCAFLRVTVRTTDTIVSIT